MEIASAGDSFLFIESIRDNITRAVQAGQPPGTPLVTELTRKVSLTSGILSTTSSPNGGATTGNAQVTTGAAITTGLGESTTTTASSTTGSQNESFAGQITPTISLLIALLLVFVH